MRLRCKKALVFVAYLLSSIVHICGNIVKTQVFISYVFPATGGQ